MLESFIKYNRDKNILQPATNILVAVSGGVDSMVLLHLLLKCGYKCAVAHCNFTLRNEESDIDQELVESTCKKYNITCFTNRFETKKYAAENKISIEMAARELRYNWFNQLIISHDFNYVAVAHNMNDVAETVLINLTRGTGIKGLTGIKYINGNIIRPLLFANRTQIEAYATIENIHFRIDKSNLENDYTRNKFRNIIIPELQKINPSFIETTAATALHLNDAYYLYSKQINEIKKEIITEKENTLYIDIEKLKQNIIPETILYEILSDYNFSKNQIPDIIDTFEKQSGKLFFSSTHSILKDRNNICIKKNEDLDIKEYTITNQTLNGTNPFNYTIKYENYISSVQLRNPDNIAIFDVDKITFPLTIRKWKKGDSFHPLGMKGTKKISDFLIDKKISIFDKNNIYVLCSNNDILWLIGYRTDDKYKVTSTTKHIMRIKIS